MPYRRDIQCSYTVSEKRGSVDVEKEIRAELSKHHRISFTSGHAKNTARNDKQKRGEANTVLRNSHEKRGELSNAGLASSQREHHMQILNAQCMHEPHEWAGDNTPQAHTILMLL